MTIRSFTGAQYVALGVRAPDVGPFALENRAPYDHGGGGRYYANRGTSILGIVIHITAGLQSVTRGVPDGSAEGVTRWGSTTTNQASWPVAVDSDSIINCLQEHRVAWLHGVPGYNFNRPLWGLEVAKLHSNWDSMPGWWVEATIRNVAIACAPIVLRHRIPLRLVTDRDYIQQRINAGAVVGFTEHWNLTPGTRQDAGRVGSRTTFPWNMFFRMLREQLDVLRGVPSTPVVGPEDITRLQELLNEHGADLVEDGDYGANTLRWAKSIAKLTGYAGKNVQVVPPYITHLEEHMSELLDQIKHVRREQDTIHDRIKKQGGQLDKIDNWSPAVVAKACAQAVWSYALYGKVAHYWLRDGGINDPEHRNFPADPGSRMDYFYRGIAAAGQPVVPHLDQDITPGIRAKLDARYPVAAPAESGEEA